LYFLSYSALGFPSPDAAAEVARQEPGRWAAEQVLGRYRIRKRRPCASGCRQAADKAVDNCPDSVDGVWTKEKQQVNWPSERRSWTNQAPFSSYLKGACSQCAAFSRRSQAGAPASTSSGAYRSGACRSGGGARSERAVSRNHTATPVARAGAAGCPATRCSAASASAAAARARASRRSGRPRRIRPGR
jgi:hypothetical protein